MGSLHSRKHVAEGERRMLKGAEHASSVLSGAWRGRRPGADGQPSQTPRGAEDWRETRVPPIGTRWVDGETLMMSRMVATGLREKGDTREGLFAATPPLDALRCLLALSFKEGLKMMVIDAPRCFWDEGSQTRALVHGVHFEVTVPTWGVCNGSKCMKDRYEVKVRAVLGRDAKGDKDIGVCVCALGRMVRWGKKRPSWMWTNSAAR